MKHYICGITISRNWNLTSICFPPLTEFTQEHEAESGASGDNRAWYAVALHLPGLSSYIRHIYDNYSTDTYLNLNFAVMGVLNSWQSWTR
jgi:hypothetical protein